MVRTETEKDKIPPPIRKNKLDNKNAYMKLFFCVKYSIR